MARGAPGSTGNQPLEEQTYTIETPEHVEIVYTVAGPGSRLLAFMLDFLIMLVPAFVLIVFIFVILSVAAEETFEELVEGGGDPTDSFVIWMVLAMITMAQFLVSQFYFVVFELVWNGQSPGKRWQRIRVIRESGQPVGFFASMLRNLIRIVDLLPLFYLTGFVAMLATRHWRRLGDLAAGSIVVKVDAQGLPAAAEPGRDRALEGSTRRQALEGEVGAPWPPADEQGPDPFLVERFEQAGLARLDPRFFDLAERYLDRRYELQPAQAANLAEKIARPVMERLGVVDVEPDRFIEQVHAYMANRARP